VGFRRDVAVGGVGERALVGVLAGAGLEAAQNKATKRSELARWDVEFRLAGRRVTAEVKTDLYEARTGNVAVEFFNSRSGKPSGIAATAADLWVVVLADGGVWAARTAALKGYFDSQPCVREVHGAGDGNASLRLFRRAELFAAVFKRLDGLPAPELLTVLEDSLACEK
jgi:hypothetical protein